MSISQSVVSGAPRDAANGDELLAPATRVVEALINAMEAKSPYLRGHSHRVAALAAALATELALPDEEVEAIRLAGKLHDVGKIGVREAVLDKPGQLTPEEFTHVQEHVSIGLNILSPLPHLEHIREYIAHHHERIDGSGYPAGLSGDSISLGGRILAAADVMDAITSPRAYRKALSLDEAISMLKSLGPRNICPVVLPVLERAVAKGHVLVFINE
jgi:putative nucleotidyltransferase with HDIG domain